MQLNPASLIPPNKSLLLVSHPGDSGADPELSRKVDRLGYANTISYVCIDLSNDIMFRERLYTTHGLNQILCYKAPE